jgi:hypothetical protein
MPTKLAGWIIGADGLAIVLIDHWNLRLHGVPHLSAALKRELTHRRKFYIPPLKRIDGTFHGRLYGDIAHIVAVTVPVHVHLVELGAHGLAFVDAEVQRGRIAGNFQDAGSWNLS